MTRRRRAIHLALLASLSACASDGGGVSPVAQNKTGTVLVVVHGLPSGSAADIELRGPSISRHITDSVTTIGDLPPATYTLVANPVESARYRVAPDSANRQFVITGAGETISKVIEYVPASGQIAVAILGLRTDVTPSVDVSGPGGFAQHVTASDTLWRLAGGSYTISAGASARGSVRYSPDSAVRTVVVTNGQTTQSDVRFIPTVSLSLNVTGLPAGAVGDIDLIAAQTTRHASGSTTLADVPLGPYTLSARDVTAGGQLYQAPPPQTVTLTEDGPFNLTVAYGHRTGSITLTITGLPHTLGPPRWPIASIVGPGFVLDISEPKTLTGLPMGNYFILAGPAVYGNNDVEFQVVGDMSQKLVQLDPAHPDATVDLPFQLSYGAIDIAFPNLPSGLKPFLSIRGPGNYLYFSERDETIQSVPAGTYTLGLPLTLGSNPLYYRSDPLPTTVTLSSANPRPRITVTFHELVWSTVNIILPGLPPGLKMPVYMDGDIPQAPISIPHIYPHQAFIYAPVAAVSGDTAAWVALNTGIQAFDLTEGVNTISFPVRQTNIVNVSLDLAGAYLGDNQVIFTGPNNTLLGTATSVKWTNLPPGQYTVKAPAYTDGTSTWTPSPATQTITIPAIGKVDVHVSFTRTP